jgi:ABC-type sulfate transport system permease component
MGTMQFFRGIVIGTLNFVAFLFFFAVIIGSAWNGYENGAQMALDAAREAGASAPTFTLPAWGWAIIYAIVGWVVASVVLGILFVLLDIQDGIRDLHRDLTKKDAPKVM